MRGFNYRRSTMNDLPTATTPDEQFLAEACKALSHPARIRILETLRRENRCICGRIVDVLPLAQSTVSQHLKILKDAGLVRGEVDGPRTCYCLDRETLNRLRRVMDEFTRPASDTDEAPCDA